LDAAERRLAAHHLPQLALDIDVLQSAKPPEPRLLPQPLEYPPFPLRLLPMPALVVRPEPLSNNYLYALYAPLTPFYTRNPKKLLTLCSLTLINTIHYNNASFY
jgi:hypothetical protein